MANDLDCIRDQAIAKDNAMSGPPVRTKDVISFGPFRLDGNERLLTRDGVAVELGARAFDMLMVLVSSPNETVSKKELIARVWPDVTVEEGSLRFHIAGLRKALGDGQSGARYITTLAGRGYCFVAPISKSSDRNDGQAAIAAGLPRAILPNRLLRMVGRADGVLAVARELAASRFVTIIGPGGVGKTTLAVAVAHDLLADFAAETHFVDLGALSDSGLVATSLSLMLGLPVSSDDPTPGLMAHLRDRRVLLILDNCEHVIESVATLAAHIFLAAPAVHMLATSREALRVEGEQVYKLAPLDVPPEDAELTAAAALKYPAIQLFVERAAASGARLELSDADAAIVAGICRKLDGMALAIELAAARVEAYGLQQTAALLDQRLSLLWQGQRTAPPRQQTLQATLDWSYGLLSDVERVVLRRLAIFVGYFTLEAALSVVTDEAVDQARLFGAIDSLVAKSMVATGPLGAMMRYRLLGATRAYALEISAQDAEFAGLAARHAAYYQRWLQQTEAEWPSLSSTRERVPYFAGIHNVRAALEWAFGGRGNTEIGVGLAAAAAPVLLAMSLLTECQRWSERAIAALGDAARGALAEMHVQTALGLALMFTRGNSEAARAALNRGLAIAEELADGPHQQQLLGALHMFHHRTGDFKIALQYARRSSAASKTIDVPAAVALAHSNLGISLNFAGDLDGARTELEAALQHGQGARRTSTIFHGFDHYTIAAVYLARNLWLQGHPVQAVNRARQAVADAAAMDHPVTLSIALMSAVAVLLWVGDLESAEEYIERFVAHAESHSLAPFLAAARGFKGELAIRRGDAEGGLKSLRDSLEKLHAVRFELLSSAFNLSIVEGLTAIGRFDDGIALIDETIRLAEVNGDLACMPELLRVKGRILLAMPQPRFDDADICLTQSLECSRGQTALGWELRTAIDLASLWASRRQPDKARALLRPVFERFVEGFDTADLQAAKRLLAALG